MKTFFKNLFGSRKQRTFKKTAKKTFRPTVEAMESRVLMAGNISFDDGILTIEGGEYQDVARVDVLTDGNEWRLRVDLYSADNANVVIDPYAPQDTNQIDHDDLTRDFADVTKIIFKGFGGNDYFGGMTGGPSVEAYGGEGNDSLSGGNSDDKLYGEGGNDVLSGWTGRDSLFGGSGNDFLHGDDGYVPHWLWDGVVAGQTDIAAFNTSMRSGDRLTEVEANENLEYFGNADYLYGEGGTDILLGGSGDDYLSGGNDNDWMHGGSGKDRLEGYGGSDYVYGGTGEDTLYGEGASSKANYGNDYLYGGADNDWLYGGFGNDSLYGEGGMDRLFGQEGHDFLDGGLDGYKDELTGGTGRDRFVRHYTYGYSPTWLRAEAGELDFNRTDDSTVIVMIF